jgi:hypothetical protein
MQIGMMALVRCAGALDKLAGERLQLGAELRQPLGCARGAEHELLEPAVLSLRLERSLVEARERAPGVGIVEGALEQWTDLLERCSKSASVSCVLASGSASRSCTTSPPPTTPG